MLNLDDQCLDFWKMKSIKSKYQTKNETHWYDAGDSMPGETIFSSIHNNSWLPDTLHTSSKQLWRSLFNLASTEIIEMNLVIYKHFDLRSSVFVRYRESKNNESYLNWIFETFLFHFLLIERWTLMIMFLL